jgi:HK97 family phage prohead protease
VKVQFDHGFDPSIGGKPLGKPSTMTPDDTGLWTETPLSRTTYNEDLLELIRDGALDGMSFRFRVTEERWVEDPAPSDYNPKGLAERTILRVDLFEFGPVTFPAYEATTLGVRSADVYRAWRVDPTIFSAAAGDSTDSHPRPDSRTDPDGDTSPVTTRAQRQVLLRRALPKLKELTR